MLQKGKCPRCNSENLDYGGLRRQDDYDFIGHLFECNECGFEGIEWYRYELTYNGMTDINGDKIENSSVEEN